MLFAIGIDLEIADPTTVQRYIRYIFRQYADRGIEDRRLWDAIQANLEDFQEEHFKMIDGSNWDLIKAYCYIHGYWLDYRYDPGKSRATILLKALHSEWYDEWTIDQIAYVDGGVGDISKTMLCVDSTDQCNYTDQETMRDTIFNLLKTVSH